MSRYPGRLAFVTALLLSAAPTMVDAVQTDVRGNWQVNINCDLNATASIFFLLDEDVDERQHHGPLHRLRHLRGAQRHQECVLVHVHAEPRRRAG